MLRLLLASFALLASQDQGHERARPLSVLFLGDRGHHVPAERAEQLIPVLASRGIDVAYTEKMADLNAANLAKYDALIVYANTTEIAAEQEKALLDYVAGGGGFVPIHCASYCFLNSPAYIELVGAQFQRHGTGEFDTKVVAPDHPIMKGVEPFRTWDETYVHTKHNEKDRTLLQVRDENGRAEPWTWVRTHGKGRVFYTAYGHDHRTWGHPSFHDLIERGIRWAANKGDVRDSRPRVASGEKKPFEYVEAKVPNYLPASRWGTLGDPITRMQKPLEPAESMKHLAVPGDFEVKLFASEPLIEGKPITMAWDHKGRLWLAESADYPNAKQPRGQGHDRIRIYEDTNNDGVADKVTTFAEELSIPTSFAFANGGIVVAQAPEFLFLKDTDGDDKADERKILFTGWDVSDTHAGPSNLRYGFDNWIWGMDGYSGFNGTVGGERVRFRQGFWRMKPDGSKLEFIRGTNNNSWGVGFSEDGLVFGSTANGCPSVYMPIPNRYYERVRGWAPTVLANIADSNRFFPITEKVRQVDWHGGFTAGAGSALYTARAYPKVYWNQTAFVAEPTGHLVATFTLARRGADVKSHNSWNLFAGDDEWVAPIAAEVGPDGYVWVLDWYNFIVQHNPTPEGFRTGRGGAYETPLRDKSHGRIYRVMPKGAKPAGMPKLDPNDPATMVAALSNDNMFWRMHAQRLLVERGKRDVVKDLAELAKASLPPRFSSDISDLSPGAIHALWTMHGLGLFNEPNADDNGVDERGVAFRAARNALDHKSAAVRRAATQVLPWTSEGTETILGRRLLGDPDPQVRLACLLAFADAAACSDKVGAYLAEKLADGALVEGDRWMRDALIAAAATHDRPFFDALARFPIPERRQDQIGPIVTRVAEHYARQAPVDSVGSRLVVMADAKPRVVEPFIAGLARGWPKDQKATLRPEVEQAMAKLFTNLGAESKSQLIMLADRWGSRAFDKFSGEIAASFLTTLRDAKASESDRINAAEKLVEFRKKDVDSLKAILEQITPRTPPALATGLIGAIGKGETPEAGALLVEAFPTLGPAARKEAVRVLLGKTEWTSALVAGIEGDKLPLTALALDQQQALAAHPEKAIAEKARALLAKGGGLPDPDRQKVIDALASKVLKGGDSEKGKLVFTQQCAKCHSHSGEGGKVGPDLTGMAAHPREELLIHILDPSRSVEGNFVQYTVSTQDGRILNGLLATESKTSVELVDSEGKTHVVQRDEIDEMAASKKSVMPEGFEKQVPPEGIADLLAFLTKRGKYLPLDLRKVATIVSTRGMFYDPEGQAERLVFRDWSPKVFEGVPFQLVDPQGDKVPNVILLYGPLGNAPPKMPRSVSVPCNAPAKAIHLLSGIGGWAYNGGSVPPTTSMIVRLHYAGGQAEDIPLKNGVHFADYIRPVDVPGSKLAFRLRGQQVRYLSVKPSRPDTIERIEFVKGDDQTAPVVMAVTVETGD